MKIRIKAYSMDYRLWILGLYHDNRAWDSDIETYKGIYSHTENSLNKILSEIISELTPIKG